MAELIKPWSDGGNLTVTYDGNGDGSSVFSSDRNEGIDREMLITFKGAEQEIERMIKQEGLRQPIRTIDDLLFCAKDGFPFGVLKSEEDHPDYSTWRGVFIQDVDGNLYEADGWDNSKIANGVVVQNDEISFVIALKNASGKCVWGTGSNIAGVNNSDSLATVKTYYNGYDETDAIIANAASSTAATNCKNFSFPNGQHGYMGAGGEWWIALSNKVAINNAISVCGGTALSGDYWCTTEQVGSNHAWAADWEDATLTNYNKAASSSVATRAFGVIKY